MYASGPLTSPFGPAAAVESAQEDSRFHLTASLARAWNVSLTTCLGALSRRYARPRRWAEQSYPRLPDFDYGALALGVQQIAEHAAVASPGHGFGRLI